MIATILALLCLLAVVVIGAVVFQDRLHLRSEAILLLERMFLAVLGLTAVVVRSYVR